MKRERSVLRFILYGILGAYVLCLLINLAFPERALLVYLLGLPYLLSLFSLRLGIRPDLLFYMAAFVQLGLLVVAIKTHKRLLSYIALLLIIINIPAGYLIMESLEAAARALAEGKHLRPWK